MAYQRYPCNILLRGALIIQDPVRHLMAFYEITSGTCLQRSPESGWDMFCSSWQTSPVVQPSHHTARAVHMLLALPRLLGCQCARSPARPAQVAKSGSANERERARACRTYCNRTHHLFMSVRGISFVLLTLCSFRAGQISAMFLCNCAQPPAACCRLRLRVLTAAHTARILTAVS